MELQKANEFLFAPRYRLRRHFIYWCCYLTLWAFYWTWVSLWLEPWVPLYKNYIKMLIWLPVFMSFSYPVAYWYVPRLLLKGRYVMFVVTMILWGLFGWYYNMFFRTYVYFPATEALNIFHGSLKVDPTSFLCLTTTAGCMTISSLAKRWIKKQNEWLQAKQEEAAAQLGLLKAQLHPHFLFNTLNNIYSFALEKSPKTPQLVLKLSSLLSYMLYDCKTNEVMLEKEVAIMKDYIDLEKERYGQKIDISVNIEGAIQDKFIAPLLILPFLENAFKHGTSEQLDKPWMSIDLSVMGSQLNCKVVNSKNEFIPFREHGVGINNVKKRLELLYPGQYELKMADEGAFFMVSLILELKREKSLEFSLANRTETKPSIYENALSFDRR